MPAGRNSTVSPDLVSRIDRAIAELQAIRAAVAAERDELSNTKVTVDDRGDECSPATLVDADDLADGNLLDTHAAQERFGHPADSLRKWARETAGTEQAVGVRRGGRWLVSIPRLQRRLNGG